MRVALVILSVATIASFVPAESKLFGGLGGKLVNTIKNLVKKPGAGNKSEPPTGAKLYDNLGADWGGVCQTGKRQSPIEFKSMLAVRDKNGQPINFVNYKLLEMTASLGPAAIKLTPESSDLEIGITGGGLRGMYVLANAHIHWPSEHVINKKRFDAELHFVHYKQKYGSVSEAVKYPDGLAVIGVLYTIGEADKGITQMKAIIEGDKSNTINGMDLLPKDTSKYFRYDGSLTTPGCDESVIWTVLQQPRTMSQEQFDWMKNLKLSEGVAIPKTYRELQSRNFRKILDVTASD